MAEANKSSALSYIFNKHSLIHWTLMLGMVIPMVIAVSPAGAATLGDLAVQGFHMAKGMVVGLMKGIPVGAEMIGNAMHGKFAASTLAEGAMHTGATLAADPTSHITAAVADPTTHMAAASSGGLKSAFASRSEWFQALPGVEQIKMQDAANMFGQSIEEYTKGWTGADKMPLPGNWR